MSSALLENNTVEKLIGEKIEEFCNEIENHLDFQIDSFLEVGDVIGNGRDAQVLEESGFKVLKHSNESCYFVELDTIVKTSIEEIVESLETGVTTKLFGITRIVGFSMAA